jgi:hypothetical protein
MSLGVGITANSEVDARALFHQALSITYKIVEIQPIEDMQTIDQNHVAPNMENWHKRGIWYPSGYGNISN